MLYVFKIRIFNMSYSLKIKRNSTNTSIIINISKQIRGRIVIAESNNIKSR